MSERPILVTGHKSPDTDSFCSAISYANLKRQMGVEAKAICAGEPNKETAFVLDYFKFDQPEIVRSFAVTVKDVLEAVPAVDSSADLTEILAWRKKYEMNKVPVTAQGKFKGLITPNKLIGALAAKLEGAGEGLTAGEIAADAKCQIIDPSLKLRDFDRGHKGQYPVVDGDTYLGMIRAEAEAPKEKQKVILVDHNEKVQIIDDIDEAEIVENIDHHRIGGLTTENPIFIHYEPVGCTCTIVANFYWQYGQEIPKNIAGLLLSAIISDTVLFRSPTCTQKDIDTATKLAAIAGVDLEAYGREMLKAGADISDFTTEQIVHNDMKEFASGDNIFTIAQISVMDTADLLSKKEELLKGLEKLRSEHNYSASYLMITNILAESTDLLYSGDAQAVVSRAFAQEPKDNQVFLANTMSRKKQIVPPILGAMK